MKQLITISLVLALISCKKEEPETVNFTVFCGTCNVDYWDGTQYLKDSLAIYRDTIGPIVDTATMDTVGWNVNVEHRQQLSKLYDGRRVYIRTTGTPGYYSFITVYYGEGKRAHTSSNSTDSIALLDFTY